MMAWLGLAWLVGGQGTEGMSVFPWKGKDSKQGGETKSKQVR